MDPEARTRTHPVHAFTARLHERLDDLANTSHFGMSVEEQGEAVVELDRAIARLAGLKLRVLAAADRNDVGEATAAATPGWLAAATVCDRRRARKDVKLSAALEGHRHRTGEALVGGAVSAEQAEVIVDAVDALPKEVGAEGREKAELHLLEQAARFGPKELKLLARHLHEVIDPDAAEEHLAKQLEAEERRAARSTFLDAWDDGRGTLRGRFAIPILAGDMWLTSLNALASPRRPDAYDRKDDDGKAKPNSVLLGQALTEYVERYPTDRLPHTGGLSTTLIVNIDAETLMGGLKSADLLTGHQISPGHARRLACEAGMLPQVLGGKSQLLDYGRTKRFHTTGQRKVIQARDKTCRADGCDVPATWCHVHHRTPWSQGGKTSVKDGVSLCSKHHHKAHDPTYDMRDGPDGKITFTRLRD